MIDLIFKAIEKAENQLTARLKETEEKSEVKTQLKTTEEIKKAAEIIGVGAIKYYDLKQNRRSNYAFSYSKMLDPKGNTAVYLLYAYARLCSILRKANFTDEMINLLKDFKIINKYEKELCIQLLLFPDIVSMALEDMEINRICDYIYDLSGKFSEFYTECRVIGGENSESRIYMVYLVREMMGVCFNILGLKALTKI